MSGEQQPDRGEGVEVVCPDCGFEDTVSGQLIGRMGMPICPRTSCGLTQMVNRRPDPEGGPGD